MLGLQLLAFGFAMWFGLYLLARDLAKRALRYAGLGLIGVFCGCPLQCPL